MRLSDIKVSGAFENTTPSKAKMDECRHNWNWYHKQDRFIVVDNNNTLVDGYVQYLVLKENGVELAEVKISNHKRKEWQRKNMDKFKMPAYVNKPTTYIYGRHYRMKHGEFSKEYVWRVPKHLLRQGFGVGLQEWDSVLVDTKYGAKPVTVTKIVRLDKCPIDKPVRPVIKVLKREA